MATVILSSPTGDVEESSTEVVQLQIVVADLDFVGLFDQLEVWRADSDADPYRELTAELLTPARLPVDAGAPPSSSVTGASLNANGATLDLVVDSQSLSITVSGTDPLTYAQIADQVTSKSTALVTAYVTVDGRFAVQSNTVGLPATLEVQSSELAALLGLPMVSPSNETSGRNARIPLVEGTGSYSFTDPYGRTGCLYRTRFRNSVVNSVSAFSPSFNVASVVGVGQSNLVQGTLDLVHANGSPLVNQEVRLHVEPAATLVDQKLVAGDDLIGVTDEQGHVEFTLVRGLELTVVISGTMIARRVTVPTSSNVSSFSLLDPTVTAEDDWFKVRVPQIAIAQRRSL
jgi:hypothetical protein